MVGRGETDIVHDQSIALGELRIDADYAVTDRLGVGLVVPLRLVSTGIAYRDASGAEVPLVMPDTHHRDETLFGIGDPWLLGRARTRLGRLLVGARLGTTLPLGQTEADPFALGDAGIEHQHIQFGSGTFNPIAMLDVGAAVGRFHLSGYALTIQGLYENDRGYQVGDRYAGGVSASTAIGRGFRAALALDAAGETAERWGGIVYDDEGNQGRFDLLAGGSLARAVGAGVELRVGVKVPLYTHVVGGQLDYPALVEVGLRFAMGRRPVAAAAEDDHDHAHGHDHGDEHAHAGEHADEPEAAQPGDDVASLGEGGQLVPLAPVLGKVTVFDFWATWCKPCVELDRRLRVLSRRYPGVLAIRRIDVVDWDSPVAEALAADGFGSLPHVKVYGTDGALRFESGGTIDQIEAKIAAEVAEAARR